MDLYAENILDHYRNPRGKKVLSAPTIEHAEINLSCGDEIKLQLKIEDGKILDIGWEGVGCAISQAAMSMLSEEIANGKWSIANRVSAKDIYDLLSVPIGPRRMKCALLSLHTFINALRKTEDKDVQSWMETINVSRTPP